MQCHRSRFHARGRSSGSWAAMVNQVQSAAVTTMTAANGGDGSRNPGAEPLTPVTWPPQSPAFVNGKAYTGWGAVLPPLELARSQGPAATAAPPPSFMVAPIQESPQTAGATPRPPSKEGMIATGVNAGENNGAESLAAGNPLGSNTSLPSSSGANQA
ncbi:unnamed protein product [Scytosiphon promiscuus]